jgi:hypothetical protein
MYTYVYMYRCIHMYIYTYMCLDLDLRIYKCTYIYINIYVQKCTTALMHIYVYSYIKLKVFNSPKFSLIFSQSYLNMGGYKTFHRIDPCVNDSSILKKCLLNYKEAIISLSQDSEK